MIEPWFCECEAVALKFTEEQKLASIVLGYFFRPHFGNYKRNLPLLINHLVKTKIERKDSKKLTWHY